MTKAWKIMDAMRLKGLAFERLDCGSYECDHCCGASRRGVEKLANAENLPTKTAQRA